MTQVVELSDKDFKAGMTTILLKVRMNNLETNRKLTILGKQIEIVRKNQEENLKLKNAVGSFFKEKKSHNNSHIKGLTEGR